MTKIKEKLIEKRLSHYYRSENHKVKNQFWLSQKRIDILIKTKETDEILAIEVKIYDWKTALRQANLNKIVCNKSYVALWHEFEHRAITHRVLFEELGIGLIIIDNNYVPRVEIDAMHSTDINPLAQQYVLAKL